MAPKPTTTTPRVPPASAGGNDSWLSNAAKHQTPDAFVFGAIGVMAIVAAIWGVEPAYAFGYGLAVAALYAFISWRRMRHEEKLKKAEVDAIYAQGETRLRTSRSRRAAG